MSVPVSSPAAAGYSAGLGSDTSATFAAGSVRPTADATHVGAQADRTAPHWHVWQAADELPQSELLATRAGVDTYGPLVKEVIAILLVSDGCHAATAAVERLCCR